MLSALRGGKYQELKPNEEIHPSFRYGQIPYEFVIQKLKRREAPTLPQGEIRTSDPREFTHVEHIILEIRNGLRIYVIPLSHYFQPIPIHHTLV